MVAVLPKSLKYICHNGAGYDNIDVAACSERKIAVSSTPVAVNDATADVGIFLMIGALRQAHVPIMTLREGKSSRRTLVSDLLADHMSHIQANGRDQLPLMERKCVPHSAMIPRARSSVF
jgi:lactate dehydrogenase-like 2-hydroxyacid dehydrogenase